MDRAVVRPDLDLDLGILLIDRGCHITREGGRMKAEAVVVEAEIGAVPAAGPEARDPPGDGTAEAGGNIQAGEAWTTEKGEEGEEAEEEADMGTEPSCSRSSFVTTTLCR